MMQIKAFLQRKGKVSDIEYLAIKDFGGKRVDVTDNQSSSTSTEIDMATQTASGSHDMFFGGGNFRMRNTTANNAQGLVKLKINGTTVEQREITITSGSQFTYEFISKGHKVATGEVIKITITAGHTGLTDYTSNLVLWEELTGDSPAV